jgi:hypothetical protein
MKKIIFPLLIIILSTVLFSACKKTANQAATTKEPAQPIKEQQQESNGFSGTVKDLMGLGKSQKCTWTTPEQGSSTVYVDGKKTRVEIIMLAVEDQPTQQMISIADPIWAYSWNPVTKKGIKVNVEEVNEETPETEKFRSLDEDDDDDKDNDNDYQTMVNQNYEFSCEPWKVDPNMFIPPVDVEFADMNAMMDQMEQNMEGMKKVCDMLTGEDKTECLEGFEE